MAAAVTTQENRVSEDVRNGCLSGLGGGRRLSVQKFENMSRATLASLPSAVAENKSRKKPAGICTKKNCRQSPYNSHLIRQFPSPIFLIPTHFAPDFSLFLHPSLSPPPSSVSSTPAIALNMYRAAATTPPLPLACLPLNLSARALNSGIQRKRKMRTSGKKERKKSQGKKIGYIMQRSSFLRKSQIGSGKVRSGGSLIRSDRCQKIQRGRDGVTKKRRDCWPSASVPLYAGEAPR